MDYPEPLSSMLRNYDWDNYITSHNPILVNSVQKSTVPYLVVKNASGCVGSRCAPNASTKVIGFIPIVYGKKTQVNDIYFDLCFLIDETGELSRESPNAHNTSLAGSHIYELPSEIREEMLLANSFAAHLYKSLKVGTLTQEKYDMLNTAIDRLIELNKTDYLKISIFFSHITPLMILASSLQQQNAVNHIIKRIIKYYLPDEIKYADKYGKTALSEANAPTKIKIIEDAIKDSELKNFIYASDKYFNDKKEKPNEINDTVFHDIGTFMGGKKKSKKRHNKKRKTRKN
jgi:hypothetical protein